MKTPRDNGDKPSVEPRGPVVWENWRAALAGAPSKGAYETPLFTDAHIIGELAEGYGPYRVLNLAAGIANGVARPALMLTVERHTDEGDMTIGDLLSRLKRTDDQVYHGGRLGDEVAALLSLSLGIRMKPGVVCRQFEPLGDPRGKPVYSALSATPLIPASDNLWPVVPRATAECSATGVLLVQTLPELSASGATTLIRAARLYQDALWLVESQAALSWLMLVSAIETAANHWRSAKDTPRARLHASKPELERRLVEVGGEAHADEVAMMIADSLGSAKKFADFVLEFLPPPPKERRPAQDRHSWNREALDRDLRIIYNYRSRALHDGIPFPRPICSSPPVHGESRLYSEVPGGICMAVMSDGATWLLKDLPMFLHVFEYIVQGALCKWWASMIAKEATAEGGCAT